ncbi:LysR family transcriptional regulator [Cupriavidus sp. CuC1]|uniref:LysR family transcriptional regulator n=1 Tax=Cupriavidus sp. CuC1 TaxID=3373131 RepID=UPI0037D53FC3
MNDLLAGFKTFCRVVDRASVSRAALDLDLAQATASRHLQELERHYGAVLIARTTRRLQITPAGQQVYDYASSVLRSEAELAQRLVEAASSMQGRITIAGPSGFGHVVLNRFLTGFGQRHPGLTIRLLLSERQVNLVEEGVDVAIRIGAPADSSLLAKPLGTLKEVLVAAPQLFPTPWRPKQPRDLAPLPRLALSRTQAARLELRRGKQMEVIASPPIFEVDSSLALLDVLVAGRGYAPIHHYLAAEALRAGRLVQLLPGWSLPAWPLNALFTSRTRPHRVDQFTQEFAVYLRDVLGMSGVCDVESVRFDQAR